MLTIEEFRAWLSSHEADDVVGVSLSETECPLARYVYQYLLIPDAVISIGKWMFCAEVNDEYINLDDYAERDMWDKPTWYSLPRWARLFVKRVDELGNHIPIRAKLARDILKRVEELSKEDEDEGI